MEIDVHEAALHEADPLSMDVDEIFEMEERDVPEQRRPQRTFMEEFIPKIGPYLSCLLDSEGAPTAFLLLYSARSVAEAPTSGFLSTEFRSGQGNTLFHHGWGGQNKLALGTQGDYAHFKVSASMRSASVGATALELPSTTCIDDGRALSGNISQTQDSIHFQGLISGATEGLLKVEGAHFQKKFGFRYNRNEEQKPGSMAVFCALCTTWNQPPENWREYENSDIIFMQGFMMDGNFQAEHMKMRNPENEFLFLKAQDSWVNGSAYLKLPDNLKLKLAIGLFHIHGHQDTCLARYSPSLIKGGRQIDGDYETLWAPLNEITRSTRGMSMSHHQEVIDDLMNDSNWKKLVDLVMDIYDIKMKQFPSHAGILLELTEKEIGASGCERHATWIGTGLKIQEMQVSCQALVKKIGSHSTPDQQREVAVKRAQLQERVDTFHKQAANILQAVSEGGADSPVIESYVGTKFDGIGEEDYDNECSSSAEDHDQTHLSGNSAADGCVDAEYILLHLPSHFGCDWCNKNAAKDLVKAELHLREDMMFTQHVRKSSKHALGRGCMLLNQQCSFTHAMVDLGASDNLLEWYKILRRQHMSVKTSVIAPQVRGQQNTRLPWFWSMDVWWDTDVGEWMEDFFRVHWLQAKAQKTQWVEELQCLQVEM
ncbi:hypothetical protein EI94DRAFT_1701995 [Lactarius quietus]|nr:hypothetical protein EI94DRAFT_1701995 [Lactarius quietus]